MSWFPRFADPWALWLLLLVPWSVYVGAKIRSLPRARKWTAITLRALILTAVILALANMEMVYKGDRLVVYFLLDHSNSIPETQRQQAVQEVRNLCEQFQGDKDDAGIIVFGENASIEQKPGPGLAIDMVRSYVNGEATDVASALRLASAAFPQGVMRRIVLLSDGNETTGAALEEAKVAQADGVGLDAVPIRIGGTREVRIREVRAPQRTAADEPAQLRIVVNATSPGPAILRIYRQTGLGGERVRDALPPQRVMLEQGDNVFVLNQELLAPGAYEYEVRIESDADSIAENNTGRAFTTVRGAPEVLIVANAPEEVAHLAEVLEAEGLRVTTIDPFAFPTSPGRLLSYGSIVLANVNSTQFTRGQLGILGALVRDQGTGLVMVGGPQAFGAGGYHETPVEEALPVSMDIKQRKVMPSCALVLVIDKSGSMAGEKVQMAKRAAIETVELLGAEDYIGVVGFDGDSYWVVDMQPAAGKSRIIQTIGAIGAGGGTHMYPALEQAYDALSQNSANLKHCIVLSDGNSQPGDFAGIMQQMAAEKITVSAVALGHDADQQLLSTIARGGGGRYYFTDNPYDIPQFFTREALVMQNNMVIEEDFTPVPKHESEVLRGITAGALPPLHGYVVTTPKDNTTVALASHEDDPVLAHWRYGLGKSVAFTSDASQRWAGEWLGWDGYRPFWVQAVRYTLRSIATGDFEVEVTREDNRGRIRVDAVDRSGQFVNFLQPKAVVTTPDTGPRTLDLEQTGPGIYEATFPAVESGVYLANVTYMDPQGNAHMAPAGLAVDYAREYAYHEANLPWLESLAAIGGGQVLAPGDSPFRHGLEASATVHPMWHWLVILAACLLPLEILVRRVVIPMAVVAAFCLRMLRRLPGMKRLVRPPRPTQAPATGVYYAAEGRAIGPAQAPTYARPTPAAPVPAEETSGAEQPSQETEPPRRGRSDYTSRLLEAKERAQQQWKRDEEDKEKRP
ncbi:MAG: VWA domain-containing protein [Candidatus Hydrogenedentota bacterium]